MKNPGPRNAGTSLRLGGGGGLTPCKPEPAWEPPSSRFLLSRARADRALPLRRPVSVSRGALSRAFFSTRAATCFSVSCLRVSVALGLPVTGAGPAGPEQQRYTGTGSIHGDESPQGLQISSGASTSAPRLSLPGRSTAVSSASFTRVWEARSWSFPFVS